MIRDEVEVEGATVRYRHWIHQDPSAQRLVLVHGTAAHAGWWEHVAPRLSAQYQVLVPDLTGHGDSDHRASYDHDLWGREVLGVAAHAGRGKPFVLVGHSMGGYVSLRLAMSRPDAVANLVLLDTPVREGMSSAQVRNKLYAERGHRRFPTIDAVVAAFRPLPDGSMADPALLRRVALASARKTVAGWEWKFDPSTFRVEPLTLSEVCPLKMPVHLVRGEFGPVTAEMVARLSSRLGCGVTTELFRGCGHNLMLDEPEATVRLLTARS